MSFETFMMWLRVILLIGMAAIWAGSVFGSAGAIVVLTFFLIAFILDMKKMFF